MRATADELALALMVAHVDLARLVARTFCEKRLPISRREAGRLLMEHASTLRITTGLLGGAAAAEIADGLDVVAEADFGAKVQRATPPSNGET